MKVQMKCFFLAKPGEESAEGEDATENDCAQSDMFYNFCFYLLLFVIIIIDKMRNVL